MCTIEIILLAFILIGFSVWTWLCWSAYKRYIKEMEKYEALRKAKYGERRPALKPLDSDELRKVLMEQAYNTALEDGYFKSYKNTTTNEDKK